MHPACREMKAWDPSCVASVDITSLLHTMFMSVKALGVGTTFSMIQRSKSSSNRIRLKCQRKKYCFQLRKVNRSSSRGGEGEEKNAKTMQRGMESDIERGKCRCGVLAKTRSLQLGLQSMCSFLDSLCHNKNPACRKPSDLSGKVRCGPHLWVYAKSVCREYCSCSDDRRRMSAHADRTQTSNTRA